MPSNTQVPQARAPLPERIGPFTLLHELGAGGMGSVHLAELAEAQGELPAGSRVALKVLHAASQADARLLGRFEREARLGSALDHPALVRVLLHGTSDSADGQRHWIAMEHVQGRTLRQVLDASGPLSEPLLRHVGAQVARALQAIHAAGALHRDVKPENVMLTQSQDVKLMDLGIAREALIVGDGPTADGPFTEAGTFLGSLAYSSPEHLGVGEVGPASDLYSLGVVLFEAAAGERPFRATTMGELVRAHLERRAARLGDVAAEVSPLLEDIVARLLAKAPAERFRSAEELAEALERGESSGTWSGARARVGAAAPSVRVPVRRDTLLVGRASELAQLEQHAAAVVAGSGCVVLLTGEAGIGKTRLVDALVAGIQAQGGWHVLYGSFPPGGAGANRGALAAALVEKLGASQLHEELRRRLPLLPRLAPVLASFLLGDLPVEGSANLAPGAAGPAFAGVLRSLAAEQPTLWVVDDLHFAAAEERELVVALAREAASLKCLLLVTTRPGADALTLAHLGRLEATRSIALARLGDDDTLLLLAEALASPSLAAALRSRVVSRSDGNPFFLLELVRDLERCGLVRRTADGTRAVVEAGGGFEVPSSVRALISGRLTALSDEDRHLLDIAAVQGFAFDPDLVARVAARPRLSVLQALAGMERRTGLVRGEGREFRFDHHQLHEVLHDLLPSALRQELHLALADAYEEREGLGDVPVGAVSGRQAVVLATHRIRGGAVVATGPLLETALRHLHAVLQDETMFELAETALTALGDERLDLQYVVHVVRMEAYNATARMELAEQELGAMEVIAERLDDPALRRRAIPGRARLLIQAGRLDEALVLLERLLPEAIATGEAGLEGLVRQALGTVFRARGRMQEAFEQHLCAGAAFIRGGRVRLAAIDGMNAAACEAEAGRMDAAITRLAGVATVLDAEEPRYAALARANMGSLLISSGRLAEGRACLEEAERTAVAFDFTLAEAGATTNLAHCDLIEGRVDEALRHARRGEELATAHRHSRLALDCLAHRARASHARSELAEARALHEECLAGRRRVGMPDAIADSLTCLTAVHHEAGDEALAIACAEEADRLVGGRCLVMIGARASAWLARLGRRDPREVRIVPGAYIPVECESHVLLFEATGDREHLRQALAILDPLQAHLSGAALEQANRFWPVARRVRAALARTPLS